MKDKAIFAYSNLGLGATEIVPSPTEHDSNKAVSGAMADRTRLSKQTAANLWLWKPYNDVRTAMETTQCRQNVQSSANKTGKNPFANRSNPYYKPVITPLVVLWLVYSHEPEGE